MSVCIYMKICYNELKIQIMSSEKILFFLHPLMFVVEMNVQFVSHLWALVPPCWMMQSPFFGISFAFVRDSAKTSSEQKVFGVYMHISLKHIIVVV